MKLAISLAAAAALVLLTACPCGDAVEKTPTPVPQLPSPELHARYAPAADGTTFDASVRVVTGESSDCLALRANASADVAPAAGGGVVALGATSSPTAAACACDDPEFAASGATVPSATAGTFRVRDDTGELAAQVPDLFVLPTAALFDFAGAPVAELRPGAHDCVDLQPANVAEMRTIEVSFTRTGSYMPAFSLSWQTGLVKSGDRWCFFVPGNAEQGAGELTVRTSATLVTSSCQASGGGSLVCEIAADVTRRIATAVVP